MNYDIDININIIDIKYIMILFHIILNNLINACFPNSHLLGVYPISMGYLLV